MDENKLSSMVFIHNLEENLSREMKKFENEVRARWCRLPALENNTIYHICPYFEDIEYFFKQHIMRIVDSACRQYHSFSGSDIELSWYIIGNYPDLLETLCKPYEDAFEAVASRGMDRLRAAQAKLESASSGRGYGYITNDMVFAFAFETVRAISGALKDVENDRLAWRDATAPQQKIHDKLAYLWNQNFESDFMNSIIAENNNVIKDLAKRFCLEFGYTFDQYLGATQTSEFSQTLQAYISQEERKKHVRQEKKEKYLSKLYTELDATEKELSTLGLAIWGKKAGVKKLILQRQAFLRNEINAITCPLPLPSSFTAYTPDTTEAFQKFMHMRDDDVYHKQYWEFRYDDASNDYVAYSPLGEPFFQLGQNFAQQYGRFRKIGAKYEGAGTYSYKTHICEQIFAIFEIVD